MASTSIVTPIVSESRINSWRFSSHIWPVLVRNWIPDIHSSSVSSTSRIKACRWWMRLVMTSFNLGLDVCAMLSSTLRVSCSSVLSLIAWLLCRSTSFHGNRRGRFHYSTFFLFWCFIRDRVDAPGCLVPAPTQHQESNLPVLLPPDVAPTPSGLCVGRCRSVPLLAVHG